MDTLYENSNPVDRVETTESILSDELRVGKTLSNWLIQLIRGPVALMSKIYVEHDQYQDN